MKVHLTHALACSAAQNIPEALKSKIDQLRIMGRKLILIRRTAFSLQGPLYFWSYMYYLSKFYELLDTVILVVKVSMTFYDPFHNKRDLELQDKYDT